MSRCPFAFRLFRLARWPLGALLALFASAAVWADGPPIRVGVEGLQAGALSFVDASGRPSGFSADLLREMARGGDAEFVLVPGSWTFLVGEFEAGRIDALANVTVTEERARTMDFSIAHATMHGVAYTRASQTPPRHSSELAGKRIGALTGTLEYLNATRNRAWGGTLVPFKSIDELFGALVAGDCDVALLTRRLSAENLRRRGVRNEFLEDVVHAYHFAVHKGDSANLARINQALARVLHDGTFDQIYDRWVGPSEPRRLRLADLRPLYIPAAVVVVALVVIFYWQRRVISQRVVQAARLTEAEERYRGLVESAFDGSVIHQEGRIESANSAFARMFGRAEDELIGRPIVELLPPERRTDAASGAWTDTGAARQTEGLRKDGARIIIEMASRACTYRGRPAFITVVRDITGRVRAETTLRESEMLFRGVFDASPIPIQLYAAEDGRLVEVNSVTLDLFGFTRDEVVGKLSQDLGIWVNPEQREGFMRRVVTEKLVRAYEARLRTKAGAEHIMLCTGALVTIAGLPRVLVSQVEITAVRQAELERAQIQSRLFLSQKYEALGTLAGGVAHDFNNILTGVINYAMLAQADCPESHPQIREFLNELLYCANRAKELVRQILLFSRSEESERGPLLLQNVVKEAMSLLRSTIPTTVEIRTDLAANAPVILANATQVQQVVMNLAINAAHAMPQGGLLTIRLRARTVDPALAAELHELDPGLHVCLEVEDTGCGMEPAVISRIFEPFFTTKNKGEGTGLGLAVVHSVMQAHHGAIRVRSRPGAGTSFELFFPVHTVSDAALGAAHRDLPRGRGQRIMIVDDEPAIGRSLQILLTRLGYHVVTFSDPERARARFLAAPDEVDLVLSDFQMPGLTGMDLAERLRASRPQLPIFIASGFAGQVTTERMHAAGITRIFTKPIELAELANALAEQFG